MKTKTYKKHGFTLIEMVVVLALVSMITVIVSAFLSQSVKTYRVKKQSIDLEEKSAQVMRDFERNTRAANKIIKAEGNELTFLRYFDLESTTPPIQVRYFVSDNQFEVGLTEPVGIAPNVTYPMNNEKIDLIIQDVTNPSALFKYFDGNNSELIFPVDINSVKMVGLTISLDKNGDLPPVPITETTKVSLRNMKDNL